MDFSTLFDSIQNTLGENLPGILGALAILVLGWIVALVVRAGVRKSLGLAKLNQRIKSAAGGELDVEGWLAKGAFYLILLLALIGFFNVLNLVAVSGPLQSLVDEVFAYAPRLAAAGVLALVAWILATVLKRLAVKGLSLTKLDEKISAEAGTRPLSDSLGNVLYWLVILLFLPGILDALGLEGLLQPTQRMVDQILQMVPNIFAAAVIGLVGWFVARLLRDLVANLLAATGVDRMGQRAGLRDSMPLSRLIGLLVFIFVIVPALIAALDALKIEAVSAPASMMLGTFMEAIPNLIAAAVIVAVAYFIGRFVAGLATSLLAGVGFDDLPARVGIAGAFRGEMTASKLVGKLILFFALLFATVEAANRLDFTQVSQLVDTFVKFGGQVLLGGIIIVVGLWISNIAYGAISGAGSANAPFFAGVVRWAILGLVFAMGLRAMGIADDIVNLAFALTLGAVAVAVALSFGLGGREAAGRQMEHWFGRLRGER